MPFRSRGGAVRQKWRRCGGGEHCVGTGPGAQEAGESIGQKCSKAAEGLMAETLKPNGVDD